MSLFATISAALAWQKQENVLVSVGKGSKAGYFSVIVYENCFVQGQVGAVRHETVQVDHSAVLPQKSVFHQVRTRRGRRRIARPADHLPAGVDGIGGAARVARQGAEVGYRAISPQERQLGLISFVRCGADNLTEVVEPGRIGVEGPLHPSRTVAYP